MAYIRTSFDGVWICDTTGDKDSIASASEGHLCVVRGADPKLFVRGTSAWVEKGAGGVEGSTIPSGLIVMWHGLLSAIPSGWLLCDGQNGTPDLRDKFVKGAAALADPGVTGGSATHTHADHAALSHSGTAVADHASHTHTYSEIVNHTHPVTDPGHTHVQNAHTHVQDAHSHIITSQTATTGAATSYEHGVLDTSSTEAEATETTATTVAVNQNATAVNQSATTGITTGNPAGGVASGTTNGPSATLTHSVTQPSDHAAQSHQTVNSEPPFYSVAFIMKA